MIARKQKTCYNNKRKSLSRANEVDVYTKDKMEKLFLYIYKKASEKGTVKGAGGMDTNGMDAIIIEFKVQDSDEKELSDTVASALGQIGRMQYEAALIQRGIPKEHIRKYDLHSGGNKS